VSRRTSTLYGLLAAALTFATGALRYATEARPYGLVVGFCALALVCWQAAADDHCRKLSLTGVAVAVAAAISSSYYAVLILAPLGAGELVRSLTRRKIDWPV